MNHLKEKHLIKQRKTKFPLLFRCFESSFWFFDSLFSFDGNNFPGNSTAMAKLSFKDSLKALEADIQHANTL